MKARAIVAWNVRRIRVHRGISQEQLAYDSNTDRSYMGAVERQDANPSIDLLDRVAETLGVHLSEFFVQPPKGATSHETLPKGRKPARSHHRKK
ncbi:helix-turn-helix transcriptional regulator [Bradyrhizobium sp. CW9]|uniref:helix-turn-helix domain-containing protein n=1 Tax=unclassified Bradyrhizobium TaxID=2631580 RepID=UPI001FF7942B|nr:MULTISPECIES: helix-turn-helix transcriptional regulator [unclassified Bradyrhizobium]MCK1329479.1 helix-turn-helix transcriptional regulator [Bradyrhizobium sp. CW9]MCK1569468.1 helix-turn-helix transcriptional regulator [Bradyrhizobium sp. 173]